MKRIVTLILAAGLILGATSAAQAVDFKVSGLWQHRVSFADRNFENTTAMTNCGRPAVCVPRST